MLTDYSFLTACVPLVRKEAASIDCSGIMDWQLRCRATAALPRLVLWVGDRFHRAVTPSLSQSLRKAHHPVIVFARKI
ncbi:hypothetical protein [Nostoc sp. LEGE 12450]|uniref:hypothetical protein n=1 Tax=Nostoc sp. LEGE 12450 TaxID=1828643 RepID=UPI0018821934|nr:hypothetical protein [Nostoc sp. LEGE 12450]MBE8988084.1 hypothetical protein [Nostoc sp. LEGE 12450]